MKILRIALMGCIASMAALMAYHVTPLFAQQQSQPASQGSPVVSQAQGEKATDTTPPPEAAQEVSAGSSAIDIKRLSGEKPLYSIELRDVQLMDLFRVFARDYNLNIIFDNTINGSITASFSNISLEEALQGIAEMSNLLLEKKGNIIRLGPHFITRIVVLKYVEAKKVLEGTASSESQAGASATGGSSAASTIYDLLSAQGKVFLGRQPNSLTVIDYPPNIEKIENYLKAIDQKIASRTFKLKYLKASDVVGDTVATQGTGSAAASGSATATSGSTSTAK